MREELAAAPGQNRSELARRMCARLAWLTPSGRPPLMSMRVAMLRLARQGWITLPPPLNRNANRTRREALVLELPEPKAVTQPVHALREFVLRPVSGRKDSRLYNHLMQAFHYLGYMPLAGAQIRYLFFSGPDVLGAIGFGAAAWKVQARDRHIGWSAAQRAQGLHLILNNSRFLILPWVRCANLASRVLGGCARRIPRDFLERYGYAPVLLETFVEQGRFRGGCYRAANWQPLGSTCGRGRMDRDRQAVLPIKEIWLYPLRRDYRRLLLGGMPDE